MLAETLDVIADSDLRHPSRECLAGLAEAADELADELAALRQAERTPQ
jgi:hypothetical protein